jgi:hypothetical protein
MNRCLRELRAMKPARFASVEADLLKRPSRVAALSTVVAAAKRTGRGDRFPHDSLLPDGPCLHQLADRSCFGWDRTYVARVRLSWPDT